MGVLNLNPAYTQMSEHAEQTLWCITADHLTLFPIEIDMTKSVDWLKAAIKATLPNQLRDVDAHKLSLYGIDVKLELHDEHIEKVRALCEELKEGVPEGVTLLTPPWQKLSCLFGTAPSEPTIRVLAGESMNSTGV